MNHSFNVEVAKKVGVNSAILFENIAFWQLKNEANEKHFHEGCYWTYNSMKAFSEMFEYLSKRQVETALKKLRDNGMLIVGNFNENRYVHVNWYSIPNEMLVKFGYKNVLNDVTKMLQRSTKNVTSEHEKCDNKYIYKQTNINKDIKPKKSTKDKYLEKIELIINEFDFSEKVINKLLEFYSTKTPSYLKNTNSIESQLILLSNDYPLEQEQLETVESAIRNQWKSCAYPKQKNFSGTKQKSDITLTREEEVEQDKRNDNFRKNIEESGGWEQYKQTHETFTF